MGFKACFVFLLFVNYPFTLMAQEATEYQATLIQIPYVKKSHSFGLGAEYLNKTPQGILSIFDQISLGLKVYPRIVPDDRRVEESRQKKGKRTDGGLDKRALTYFDLNYRVEKCFLRHGLCLGFSPLTVNLYTTWDRIRTYFSPSFSLRIQPQITDKMDLDLSYETKTFFDKNVKDTLRSEITIWSLGIRWQN